MAVPSLTQLASAISAQSPAIRKYAIEQARQSLAAEKDLAILTSRLAALEARPAGGGDSMWPRARADFGGDLQAMVDQMPDGSACIIDGIFELTDTLDLSDKRSLRLEGYGGTGFNEGGRWGAVIRAMKPGMTLINSDGGASVNHSGPEFSHITLHAGVADVGTMLRLRQVNHGEVYKLSLQGSFQVGIDADVPSVRYPSGDMAYWDLDKLTISCTRPNSIGLLVGDGYIRLRSANFDMTGDDAYGVKCMRGVVVATLSKWNHGGHHFYTEGSGSKLIGNDFEIFENPVYAVEVARPPDDAQPLLNQGTRNLVALNAFTPHGPAGKHCKFGVGTYANAYAYNTAFWNDALSVVDEGHHNLVELKAW